MSFRRRSMLIAAAGVSLTTVGLVFAELPAGKPGTEGAPSVEKPAQAGTGPLASASSTAASSTAKLPSTPSAKPAEPKPGTGGQKAKSAAALSITPAREAAALTFVRTNHPELADLLTKLKERRPHEYQKALRELFRVSERLAESQEKQPHRYELELNEWKLQSRIQLLVARMTMGRTPELEQELRNLLGEQLDLRMAILQLDHERAAARAQSLQRDLDDFGARRQQLLDERFEKAVKSAGLKKQNLKSSSNP